MSIVRWLAPPCSGPLSVPTAVVMAPDQPQGLIVPTPDPPRLTTPEPLPDSYVVQPGDTLVGLATRFFGQANRWPAIKAYNNLRREGLWVGETLKIPHMGESNAHKDPALPSDTIAKPRSRVIEGFADPRRAALDYDALGRGSVGIGFEGDDGD